MSQVYAIQVCRFNREMDTQSKYINLGTKITEINANQLESLKLRISDHLLSIKKEFVAACHLVYDEKELDDNELDREESHNEIMGEVAKTKSVEGLLGVWAINDGLDINTGEPIVSHLSMTVHDLDNL